MKIRFPLILALIVLLISVVALIFVLAIPCNAKTTVPLYQDASGWQVWKAHSGSEMIDAWDTNPLRQPIPKAYEYMEHNGASTYYGFSLTVPDNLTIYWTKNSQIMLSYTCGKDTCRAYSTEWFFTTKCICEVRGSTAGAVISLPNDWTLTSKEGRPILFAKFSFPTDNHDKIIGCAVQNVMVKERR